MSGLSQIKLMFAGILHLLAMAPGYAEYPGHKTQSVFFPPAVVRSMQANVAASTWGQAQTRRCLESARLWLELSDDELWAAMFSANIPRSHYVLSNGSCPACKEGVPMNSWKIDALRRPWKVTCPHCDAVFPKNDFAAFYRTGLDPHGIFAPDRADRSLLSNLEHPGIEDAQRSFGVDDGTGYHDGTHRWYFIGAYLVHGQWKQMVMGGIRTLAAAYVLTGDRVYARKAAIMLDRVADLYPSFDFLSQGLSYERADPIVGAGMVTVWHDACRESMELALAYDMIFPAMADDRELVQFLAAKASAHRLENPKRSFADIQRNIEDGILRQVIRRPDRILSNFPNTEVTLIMNQAIIGWPGNREPLEEALQAMLEKATAVDGLSGEKGLASYGAFAPQTVAGVLSLFDRLAPDLLPTLVNRVPTLKQLFRFHVDTWLGEIYYPKIGDAGAFGMRDPSYAGASFSKAGYDPAQGGIPFVSDFSLFWKLYEITGDPTYVRLLYRANANVLTDLPYDLLSAHPGQFQQAVAAVMRDQGTTLSVAAVNKEAWCLAILRSGTGATSRAVWLDYDIGGNHGRGDAMNIGLFAHGLELLSGRGYPPVQFGGWHSPRANWYKMTAAHNTIVVDGKNQFARFGQPETEPLQVQLNPLKGQVRGQTTAWANGAEVQLIRASGPALVQSTTLQQYERSLLLVNLSPEDSYVLDVFRVTGGRDHAKFLHGYFGDATATGLELQPMADFGHGTQMRNFRGGSPLPGWQVDWKVDDRYGYLPIGTEVHLRYTDLTRHTQAALAESWLMYHDAGENREAWVPSLLVRRQTATAQPLASTFVALLEPYAGRSNLKAITRLKLLTAAGGDAGDAHVAVAVEQADGKTDMLVASADFPPDAPRRVLVQPDWSFATDAEFCMVRRDAVGLIEHLFLSRGSFLKCGGMHLELEPDIDLFEAEVRDGKLVILHGAPQDVRKSSLGP
jgi:hypothetical protein